MQMKNDRWDRALSKVIGILAMISAIFSRAIGLKRRLKSASVRNSLRKPLTADRFVRRARDFRSNRWL